MNPELSIKLNEAINTRNPYALYTELPHDLADESIKTMKILGIEEFDKAKSVYLKYVEKLVEILVDTKNKLINKAFVDLKKVLIERNIPYKQIESDTIAYNYNNITKRVSEYYNEDINVEDYFIKYNNKHNECDKLKYEMYKIDYLLTGLFHSFAPNVDKFNIISSALLSLGVKYTSDDEEIQKLYSNRFFKLSKGQIDTYVVKRVIRYYLGDTNYVIEWTLGGNIITIKNIIMDLIKRKQEFDIIKVYNLVKNYGDTETVELLTKVILNQV